MTTQPKIIRSIVQQHLVLQKLSQRAQHLSVLNRLLLNALPDQFAPHCHLANMIGSTLIIHVDSAAHASLMRFQVPELTHTLGTAMNTAITHIEIKVRSHDTKF